MFYSFLDFLVCPACRTMLTLLAPVERPRRTSMRMHRPARMGPVGALVGPVPATLPSTRLAQLLAETSTPPSRHDREFDVEVVEGVLACAGCGRWFPIRDTLPDCFPTTCAHGTRSVSG